MKRIIHDFRLFPFWLQKIFWRFMHRVLVSRYTGKELEYLNYGYAYLDDEEPISISDTDVLEKYCLQLYLHTIGDTNLNGKEILEVGSGRGGGAAYLSRNFQKKSYIGLDLSKRVIRYCNRNYAIQGLSFIYGNAQKLPFENQSFDAIVNIESSRDYPDMDAFLSESFRVLRPNGRLLFADLRSSEDVPLLLEQFSKAGFVIVRERNIVKNVIKALELDTKRRRDLVKQKAPKLLRGIATEFTGVKGSARHEGFVDGSLVYLSYILEKPE
ncbi:MAG: class I SAM-dependent methyltransferase [Asgard group archaeon]|nr:class I SAM-dependent methyltransferase [Asgard group archaeon]